jgi:hypothetical protein
MLNARRPFRCLQVGMNAWTASFRTELHQEFGWNRGQYLVIPAGCRFTGMRNPVAAAQHR